MGKTADGSTIDAGVVLFDLFDGIGDYGTITAGDLSSTIPNSTLNARTFDTRTIDNGNGYPHDAVNIVLNDLSGSSFAGNNTQSQVLTLLHELGHAMQYIFGSGTNSFDQTDGGDPTKSGTNNDKVKQNCDL